MQWSYGVLTVPERRSDLLPQTIRSLASAGFDDPVLFIDGHDGNDADYEPFSIVSRSPRIGPAGNWTLALWELYLRHPAANRYALFQDDLLACRNLRGYLERCRYEKGTYLNLFSFPHNEDLCPLEGGKRRVGWHDSCQYGKGAVALVFDVHTVVELLSSYVFVQSFMDVKKSKASIDGKIAVALHQRSGLKLGKPYRELVHYPSLVQHVGEESSMDDWKTGRPKGKWPPETRSRSFPGEDFDAMDLLSD